MKDFTGRYAELLLASALLAGACAGARNASAPATGSNSASSAAGASCPAERMSNPEARVLVDKYCVSCHSPDGSAGEEHDFRSDPAISSRRRNIEANLRLHAMPPPGAPQPSDAERDALRCWAKQ
ncbi:MAG TPA: hypothetical protein VGJ91_05825 [Polyangiaceae bacterium]|jgi:mono/diheme cytochrome c family protein